MAQKSIDLAGLFESITKALGENRDALDQADYYNHDHGTNMVNTFRTITDALKEKQGASNSEALYHAAEQLKQSGTSGSSRLYAQNLEQAASKAKGTRVSAADALDLLQNLMGGEQAQEALQAQQTEEPTTQAGTGLGGLIGRLLDAASTQQVQQAAVPSSTDSGLGVDGILGIITSLLGAGQGSDPGAGLQTLVQAFTGGSDTSRTYRQQSSSVIVNTVLQAITSMMAK
jgi:hypothetical protein